MDFVAYPKIPARRLGGEVSTDGPFVALEKIHGAQLVVSCSEDGVRFGKRKSWLTASDEFFGWQLLRGTLERSAREIHAILKRPVAMYGEAFPFAFSRLTSAEEDSLWEDLRAQGSLVSSRMD